MKTFFFIPMLLIWSFAAYAQETETIKRINALHERLRTNGISVSDALTDTSLMNLHSWTIFRDVIRDHAKQGKIRITNANEPGTKITVKGIITNFEGTPLAGKIVYVYQTSSAGWYSDTAPHILKNEGDRLHARLFGYFKTNNDGSFEFETIQPHGYPHSGLPAHIHIEIPILNHGFVSELLFDDDERLVGNVRTTALALHYPVSKNEGTAEKPVYVYKIVAR